MQRRSWLKLGLASAAVLALGGGALALIEPGLRDARLAPAGRLIFTHVGRAMLDGSLPTGSAERDTALQGLLTRVDALVSGLPPHAQADLSQLLSLLASSAGRRAVAGLAPSWEAASIEEIQAALQSMRTASLSLRQQAYHALHDIASSAYFSEVSTWPVLGYPGPTPV